MSLSYAWLKKYVYVLTSFLVRAAPKSWSKYTTNNCTSKLYGIAQYSGDLNTYNLKFRKKSSDFKWCDNPAVVAWSVKKKKNGVIFNSGLCTRPTIQIPEQNIRKQDGVNLSGIQKVGYSNSGPFGIRSLFDHSNTELQRGSEYQTRGQ